MKLGGEHKKIVVNILVISTLLLFQTAYSQEIFSPSVFGGTLNQLINSEANGGALTVGLNIVKARRTYEIAIILDDVEKINGAEFVHKFFINNKKPSEGYNIKSYNLRPYVVYNLVFRRAISETQKDNNLIIHRSDYYKISELEEPKKVNTIQHYLGLGIEKDVFRHIYINVSSIVGFQLGKNNNNNKIDSSSEQHQENTFTWNLKFGLGFRF